MNENAGMPKCKAKPVFSTQIQVSTGDVKTKAVVENRNINYTVVHFSVKGASERQKILIRCKNRFQISVRTAPDKKLPDEFTIDVPIVISGKSYINDDFRQISLNLCKCVCSHGQMFGKVILKDAWYMPESFREMCRRAIIHESIKQQIRNEKRQSGARTVYKNNNLQRPFQGGGVSPR